MIASVSDVQVAVGGSEREKGTTAPAWSDEHGALVYDGSPTIERAEQVCVVYVDDLNRRITTIFGSGHVDVRSFSSGKYEDAKERCMRECASLGKGGGVFLPW